MARKELDRFAKNAKRDMQIATKLMLIIGAAVIVSCAVVGAVSLVVFDAGMTDSTIEDLSHTADGVEQTIADKRTQLAGYTSILADSMDLRQAVSGGSSRALQDTVLRSVRNADLSFLFVTDKNGRVLPGGGVKITDGVDVSYIGAVASALKGAASTGIEGVANFNYAIIASYPIYVGGRVSGAVVAGYDLAEGPLANMISQSYNVECTVFKDDLRVASTLKDSSGKSVVGTKLENSFVEGVVLKDGNGWVGPAEIRGVAYYGYYFPIESGDGRITGMVFVAKNMKATTSVRNHTLIVVLIVMAVIALSLIIGSGIFVRWLMWRIYNVTNTLKDMETGEADLTKRCKLFIRDEIGDLVIHFDFFCDKLQQIVSEIKKSRDSLSGAGAEMTKATDDTANAIVGITDSISDIRTQISAQGESVHQTATSVTEISRSIIILNGMIESQSNGVGEASAAVEEMVGNIASVNSSVDKMADSFEDLAKNAQAGFSKQQDVNEKIKQIEGQSKTLQEANKTIAQIANETNLLAMNAAIEAAHAGDSGRGFSVVADEIRKLSETSREQSKTIGEQLKKIKDSITSVVSASQESGVALAAVSGKIRETDQLVVQIKSAMGEQRSGSEQIVSALANMKSSTGEVQQSSKDMAMRNEEIMREIKSLQDMTRSMSDNMEKVSAGAGKIGETGASLLEISKKVRESIDKIGGEIDLFKV